MLEIKTRPGRKLDEDFIYSSWIHCLGNVRPYCSLDKNWFSSAQHSLIDHLLDRSHVLVAHDPEDDNQIYGYLVCEPKKNVLHWVYVKQLFRRADIGTRLINQALNTNADIIVSIRTPTITSLSEKWGLTFHTHALCESHV